MNDSIISLFGWTDPRPVSITCWCHDLSMLLLIRCVTHLPVSYLDLQILTYTLHTTIYTSNPARYFPESKHVCARLHSHSLDVGGLSFSMHWFNKKQFCFSGRRNMFFSSLSLSHFLHSCMWLLGAVRRLTETQFFLCVFFFCFIITPHATCLLHLQMSKHALS